MRSHARALPAALLIALVGGLTVPSAGTAQAAAPALRPASAADVVTPIDAVTTVLHHNGDPRQGTIRLALTLQRRSGQQVRTLATVTKATGAVRVQIDRITVTAEQSGSGTRLQVDDRTPVGSGTGSSVTKATAWLDATRLSLVSVFDVRGAVRYSTRWADGSLTSGSMPIGDMFPSRSPGPSTSDERTIDAAGSVVLGHYGDPTRGSVSVSAGIRLSRTITHIVAIQPFATITRRAGATRVQIDAIEAVGYDNVYNAPQPSASILAKQSFAWPASSAIRSSGSGASASSSTAITPVFADRRSTRSFFRVAVYYTVLWSDGQVARGRYLSPVSGLDHSLSF